MRRAGHVSVCLDYNGERPLLLVTGGVDEDNNVLNDLWILDIQSARWRKVANLTLYIVRHHETCPVS